MKHTVGRRSRLAPPPRYLLQRLPPDGHMSLIWEVGHTGSESKPGYTRPGGGYCTLRVNMEGRGGKKCDG
ncbi:hypothetical protein NQZ68_007624 [Dissostichus eleginoides]|nr:hypothetical protein NQZ68_007624 [Dissostichus eleginoides]